MKSKK